MIATKGLFGKVLNNFSRSAFLVQGTKEFMSGMGLGMLTEQLADLKLGELLDTPPPGLDEAVAIAKVSDCLLKRAETVFFPKQMPQVCRVSCAYVTITPSMRLHSLQALSNMQGMRLGMFSLLMQFVLERMGHARHLHRASVEQTCHRAV